MTDNSRIPISLLILDMDNTLYDWVSYFVPAVEAMLKQAAKVLEVGEEELRDDLRQVHIAYGNTEHPFALLETKTVLALLPTATPAERYEFLAPAFAAFDAERINRLKLYPGVDEVLRLVRAHGCAIVGHTEATDVNIGSRARRLGLNGLLDAIYAPGFEGPPHPLGSLYRPSSDSVSLHRLPMDARKPSPRIVRQILLDYGAVAGRALYVGDSISRDIRMAKEAGVWAAWARYGIRHDPSLWRDLVSVSHWQATAVATAERDSVVARATEPDVILDSFPEILHAFSFGRSERAD